MRRVEIPVLLLTAAVFVCQGCGKIRGPSFPYVSSPRVIVATPASPASGNITISFQVIDRELESADILVQYSTDGGQTFATVTLTDPADAISLASDWYPGAAHSVQWDSVTDMVGRSSEVSVCVRITPSDASNPAGEPVVSETFTVNNLAYNEPPTATASTPAGVQLGGIRINYFLSDVEGDTCSTVVHYSTDNGSTYQAATMGPAGDGRSGLSSSPSGSSHMFLWDSRADGVAPSGQQDTVSVRVTPTDFAEGAAGETATFSVDNSVPNIPPTVSITGGPIDGSTVFTSRVTFTWSGSDTDGTVAGYYYSFDHDPPNVWTTDVSVTSDALSQGEHTFRVVAVDDGCDFSSVESRTFNVTSQLLSTVYVATTGNDTTGEGTLDNPYATIQKGLDSALSATTVLVLDGTYTGAGNKDLDFAGKSIHLKSAGGAANCIIDCQSSGRGLYFHTGETADAILEGFTIQNGSVPDLSYGGGILCSSCSPTIKSCHVLNNNGGGAGGGIYCRIGASPTIEDCVVDNNTALSTGGGIRCWTNSNPVIRNCTITNNHATGTGSIGNGGGIYCYDSSPTIEGCTISANTAKRGGGVACNASSPDIVNCIIESNVAHATADGGGGMHFYEDCNSLITNCVIRDNQATCGAGFLFNKGCTAQLVNCLIADNSSSLGGGVMSGNNSNPTLINCTVAGNTASVNGGGVYVLDADTTLNNCIIWGNTASSDGNQFYTYETAGTSQVVLSYCDYSDNAGDIGGIGTFSPDANCITGDALFIGGGNYRLRGTSPCIDAGSDSLVPVGVASDLDGNTRIMGSTVDIGTYECQASGPRNWVERFPASKPSERHAHAMAYDSARGVVVLFGGWADGYNDETWEWDGINWTQWFPANKPVVRDEHAMAYDSARSVTVLFGGSVYLVGPVGETWEWNGTNWTQKSPVNEPSPRRCHAMAYDSARGVVVLFGGAEDGPYFDDTWEWDGTNWTQRFPVSKPIGRMWHSMAYDSGRGVVVLFGGFSYDGTLYYKCYDTWEWDGSNWTQKTPASRPSASYACPIAYDSSRGAVVLFGGYDGSNWFDETWVWDGTNWAQEFPTDDPSLRCWHAMTYDSARGVTVLFGGKRWSPTGDYNDTWEY